MSDTKSEPLGQRRLSDVAREIAAKNKAQSTRTASSLPASLRQDVLDQDAPRCDENEVQKELLAMMTEKNAPRIDTRARTILSDAATLADELDRTGAALEKALRSWMERSNEAVETLRARRMAITSEINQTAQSVKDASGFLNDLNKGDAFATLAKLAEVGAALKKAYGDDGLVRLADALLVLSEKS